MATSQILGAAALGRWDWMVIGIYFAILFGIAWRVILKSKDTADDYFLAGRNLGWFIVGASIFASNIGSEHLVGLAGSGATDGVAMAHYELHAWCLLVLGWIMVPFYMRSRVFTMPEFLERRFTPTARWVLSIISLVAYVLTKIAVGIFAGGIVFSVLLPDIHFMGLDSFWIGSFLVIVLTGIYTILGGLRAVVYTDTVQTIILVFGSILVTIFGLRALGGWGELRAICGSDMFNLWKPLVPANVEGTWAPVKEAGRMAWYFNDNYPWLGMLFCAPIIGLWYWCTDQYIVQRALGTPNERAARRGSIWASFLKLLPVFIFIIPGMICFALAKGYVGNEKASIDANISVVSERTSDLETSLFVDNAKVIRLAQQGDEVAFREYVRDDAALMEAFGRENRLDAVKTSLVEAEDRVVVLSEETGKYEKSDQGTGRYLLRGESQKAFPLLVMHVLPVGIRGIVVAGLLAALMSSLSSVFNASSTLFTMDFYSKFRPRASQHRLVWTGRVATAVMVLIGLLWIPVIRGGKGLYDYLQGIQAYLAPPIFVVFFLGVFMKRLNGKGCLAALIIGFLLGLFRLAVDTPVKLIGTQYQQGSFFWIINNIFFQYYSLLIFVVCVIVMIVVSYLTEPPSYEKISGLTYGTRTLEDRRNSRASWSKTEVIFSIVLLIFIVAAYLYFTG